MALQTSQLLSSACLVLLIRPYKETQKKPIQSGVVLLGATRNSCRLFPLFLLLIIWAWPSYFLCSTCSCSFTHHIHGSYKRQTKSKVSRLMFSFPESFPETSPYISLVRTVSYCCLLSIWEVQEDNCLAWYLAMANTTKWLRIKDNNSRVEQEIMQDISPPKIKASCKNDAVSISVLE